MEWVPIRNIIDRRLASAQPKTCAHTISMTSHTAHTFYVRAYLYAVTYIPHRNPSFVGSVETTQRRSTAHNGTQRRRCAVVRRCVVSTDRLLFSGSRLDRQWFLRFICAQRKNDRIYALTVTNRDTSDTCRMLASMTNRNFHGK